MPNRILRSWVGRGTYWMSSQRSLVYSQLFSSMVLLPSTCPSSNGSNPIHVIPRCNYLVHTTSNRAIRPLNLERLWKEGQQGIEEQLHQKNTKRESDLALSMDVRSLGQRNTSGDLLSTNLSLSLAGTS
jgi:hypothetical protein